MVSSKKKWTDVNPIRRRMKKCKASSGQNGQLVHWWLLVHSGPSAGPGNGDDVAASHVSKRPAPLCAAFPQIGAFYTAMPTIQLPTAVLFVFIDPLARSRRCTCLSNNVMSERLAPSRQQFFFSSFLMSKFWRNLTKF